MPHLALYRKYRSKDFNELAGQSHVVQSLENAIKHGRVSHAYLFSGPRGTGKTSTARILARKINGLSLSEAENHLDIIEIDAASNRRIDEIRELRDKIHIAPTHGKYKVYIIDEVHMLTNEAFNALLKTLEEPPEHAVFVLATTEIFKLPETIISRTQHFRFEPISIEASSQQLRKVADAEQLKIDDVVLQMIAEAGHGSLRDSLSILDQLANLRLKTISAKAVRDLLGWGNSTEIELLALHIVKNELAEAIGLLKKLSDEGVSFAQLLEQLMAIYSKAIHLQMGLVESSSDSVQKLSKESSVSSLSKLVASLSNIPANSPYLEERVESVLIEICLQNSDSPKLIHAVKDRPAQKPVLNNIAPINTSKATAERTEKLESGSSKIDDSWVRILSEVKKHNNSLYALLRSAEPSLQKDTLSIMFRFQFHKRRLEEADNLNLLKQATAKILGNSITIQVEVKQPRKKAESSPDESRQDKDAVNSVLQILGGEVVNG